MKNTNKPNLKTFESALKEYSTKKSIEFTRCEICNQLLKVSPQGNTALLISCECGLYNDTLRGF